MVDKRVDGVDIILLIKSLLKGTSLDGLKYRSDRGNHFVEITGGNTWGTRLNGSECYIKKDKDSIINDKKTIIEKVEKKAIADFSFNKSSKEGICRYCDNLIDKKISSESETYKCKYDCAKTSNCLGVSYVNDNGYKYCRFHMIDKTEPKGNLPKDSKFKEWTSSYPYCNRIEGGTFTDNLKGSKCFIKKDKDSLISKAEKDFLKSDIFTKYNIEQNYSFCKECDNYIDITDREFKDKKDIITTTQQTTTTTAQQHNNSTQHTQHTTTSTQLQQN